MIELILKGGMGDAIKARAFIITYCKQKSIPHNKVKIRSAKFLEFFENDGFNLEDFKGIIDLKKFYHYQGIGFINIPRKYEDRRNHENNILINLGVTFDRNVIVPFNWREETLDLDLPEKFITVNYGYDNMVKGISDKTWPLEYWKELVSKIGIPCVQIGAGKNCRDIEGVHLNLVNKLSIKGSSEVMKRALFHIDIEGGLVILNHNLGCKSVVLFGPTAIQLYGFKTNLNLLNTTCEKCPCRPFEINNINPNDLYVNGVKICNSKCMKELKPDFVLDKIKEAGWL